MVPGHFDCWVHRRRIFYNGVSPNGDCADDMQDGRHASSGGWKLELELEPEPEAEPEPEPGGGSHPPLRHLTPHPATNGARDQNEYGGTPKTGAQQFSSIRAGLRLADVDVLQPGWHNVIPGG